MDKFRERLKKEYESVLAEEDDVLEVISTGVISLDVLLGIGGIPKGRISIIYGAETSGKTTLTLEICKNAIKAGNKVLYIDVEQVLSLAYVKEIFDDEVDISNFVLVQPNTAEDALEIAEIGIQGNTKFGASPGEFGLIVVDSIGALAPEKEQSDDLTDKNVSLVSKLMTVFLRRNMFNLRKNKTGLIFIGQVRDKIGGYVSGYSISGGHALLHYASVILFLSRTSTIKDTNGEPIGINVSATTKKNKLSVPFRKWDKLPIMFEGGVDFYRDLIEFASLSGYLHKRGPYYVYNDETLGQGIVDTINKLKEAPEILADIIKSCYSTITLMLDESSEDDLTEVEDVV